MGIRVPEVTNKISLEIIQLCFKFRLDPLIEYLREGFETKRRSEIPSGRDENGAIETEA